MFTSAPRGIRTTCACIFPEKKTQLPWTSSFFDWSTWQKTRVWNVSVNLAKLLSCGFALLFSKFYNGEEGNAYKNAWEHDSARADWSDHLSWQRMGQGSDHRDNGMWGSVRQGNISNLLVFFWPAFTSHNFPIMLLLSSRWNMLMLVIFRMHTEKRYDCWSTIVVVSPLKSTMRHLSSDLIIPLQERHGSPRSSSYSGPSCQHTTPGKRVDWINQGQTVRTDLQQTAELLCHSCGSSEPRT
jgi:hypothetical protein